MLSLFLCPGRGSNPHALRHTILSRACMPIPPPGHAHWNIIKRTSINNSITRSRASSKILLVSGQYNDEAWAGIEPAMSVLQTDALATSPPGPFKVLPLLFPLYKEQVHLLLLLSRYFL